MICRDDFFDFFGDFVVFIFIAVTKLLNQSRLLDLFAQVLCRSPLTDRRSDMLAAHFARSAKIYGAIAFLSTAWSRLKTNELGF